MSKTVTSVIQLELRCNVCDSVLYVVTESKSDKNGTYFYVERCEKCYAAFEKLQAIDKASREVSKSAKDHGWNYVVDGEKLLHLDELLEA